MQSTRSRSVVPLDGPPAPYVRVAPPSSSNAAEDVIDLMDALGHPLDEWQEEVLAAALGERRDGRWSAKYVGLSAPRQNGKSELIVARALAGVLLFGERMIIISAHETDTAREIWKRLLDVIEANSSVERRVTDRINAINREQLTFGRGRERQTIKLKARRVSGARGFSCDCLLLDEGQILGKRAWGSIQPTMSARKNPQLWLFGTPPTPDDDAYAFTRVREASLKNRPRFCWIEYAAAPGDDFDDPATWAKANPAYGVRISHEACADDRAAMDDDQFALERLGQWADLSAAGAFGIGSWQACRVDERPASARISSLGVAVSIDLASAAIVGAGEDDYGRVHIKPLASGPEPYDWFVSSTITLANAYGVPVVIDGRGPGAVFIPLLKDALGDRLRVVSTSDVLDACAGIFAGVQSRMVTHASYSELDEAVSGASKRDVHDRWAWGRRKSSGDISPLEAATLAHWGVAADYEPAPVSVYESRGVLTI